LRTMTTPNAVRWLVATIVAGGQVASELTFNPIVTAKATRVAPIMNVPAYFLVQLLQIEDKRFFLHPGVDPIAVVRASAANIVGYGVVQGASTITQQLYNIRRDEKGLARHKGVTNKVLQTAWALAKDARSSKLEILEEYLGTVYWGRSYRGIDAAALGYFNTTRDQLTPAQSFFLAERLAGPNIIIVDRVRALLRRSPILRLLSEYGDSWEELSAIYDEHFGLTPFSVPGAMRV
jgi:membrane peptidoglycan carboxypeptidase